jgi:hypothetical protein
MESGAARVAGGGIHQPSRSVSGGKPMTGEQMISRAWMVVMVAAILGCIAFVGFIAWVAWGLMSMVGLL